MRNQRGVTLISLLIIIVILFILSSTTVYTSIDRMKINNLNKMYNDIEVLEDKISSYFLKFGGIPILKIDGNNVPYTHTTISFNTNINDDENYYIIDLEVIGDITLNYGEEGYKNPNQSEDVYIINGNTHTIYYVKGIESINGNIYHSKAPEGEETVDNVPPTKPTINVISGTIDDSIDNTDSIISYYKSDVEIEIIPGKDNWSGVKNINYKITKINSSNNTSIIEETITEQTVIDITNSGNYTIEATTTDNNGNYSDTSVLEFVVTYEMIADNIEKLAYIESNGTQYIDTGVLPNNNTGIDIDFKVLEYLDKNNSNQYVCFVFGGEDAWMKNSFDLSAGVYGLVYETHKVGTEYNTVTLSDRNKDRHNLRIINGQYYFDNEYQYDLKQISSETWSASTSIALFGIKRNNTITRMDSCRIYHCKIYDGETLIRNLIPCIKLDEDIIGMYDTVNGVMYTNLGTGVFAYRH